MGLKMAKTEKLDKKAAAIEVYKHANTAYYLGLVGMVGGLISLLVTVVSTIIGAAIFMAVAAYIGFVIRKEKQHMVYLQDKYKINPNSRF